MLNNRYNNFVQASAHSETVHKLPVLSGEQAREIYLHEINNASTTPTHNHKLREHKTARKVYSQGNISKKNLFMSVQSNDLKGLQTMLDSCPNLVNTVDEYGWSLLMIACQANSVDAVKELLKRGIDSNVRDKGGNSATTLVIKNKNLELADILIQHKSNVESTKNTPEGCESLSKIGKKIKTKFKKNYACKICKQEFPDKEEHLASTVHNICASKDKKIPTNYVIPQSNRGYQIMLKVGWDKESGLGKDGLGKKCPIKVVQKKDRKGIGHEKKKAEPSKEECKNSKLVTRTSKNEKRMEIHFRREFY